MQFHHTRHPFHNENRSSSDYAGGIFYSVSKKILIFFWQFFQNGWKFLVQILRPYYMFYLR